MGLNTWQKAAVATAGGIVVGTYLDNKHAIVHDLSLAARMGPLKKLMEARARLPGGYQVTDQWYETFAKYKHKKAIYFEDTVMTYLDIEKLSNRISHWALSKGLKKGDVVALNMENRAEYVPTWLGLTKIGVVVALINYNVKKKPLLHCVAAASAKVMIFGTEVAEAVGDVADEFASQGVRLVAYGPGESPSYAESLDAALPSFPDRPVDKGYRAGIGMQDTFGYIYSSGTTGLPKACVVAHAKFMGYGLVFKYGFKVTPEDRIYIALPLYHTAGGGIGVGQMLSGGSSIVIKRKFSVREFWQDCKRYKVTVIQYIGELCRYLVAQAPSPLDQDHKVRLAIGNGMRPEVWDKFQRRFNIPEVGEFYGATEGNVALLNHCKNHVGQGAVGRLGTLAKKIQGVRIVKFDVENEEPLRNAEGFCIECGPGEVGELLSEIKDDVVRQFKGYSDPAATKKKIMHDVFAKGDKYFRTGDLLRYDSQNYFYFVDRIGDTFRWKGENVSTMEVSEIVSSFKNVVEANVYGIQIPGADGRACMVGLVTNGEIDPVEFSKYVQEHLPSYSVPLFVRFLKEMDVTGTFKHQKNRLRDDGYNPQVVKDPLWWFNSNSKQYEPFDLKAYDSLIAGGARL